jgi:hypothetical protein
MVLNARTAVVTALRHSTLTEFERERAYLLWCQKAGVVGLQLELDALRQREGLDDAPPAVDRRAPGV